MRGRIVKVWPFNERGPGSVVFDTETGQQKFSTFDENLLAVARRLDGQEVYYTTATHGKYVNLSALETAAPKPSPVSTPPDVAGPLPLAGFALLADAIDRLALAVWRLNPDAAFAAAPQAGVGKATGSTGEGPGGGSSVDLEHARRAVKLAAIFGDQGAGLMLSVLAKKHTTKDAYDAAVAALLAQHGDEAVPF